MVSVSRSEEALDDLARHDGWRRSLGWDPIALAIMEAIEAYFDQQDPAEEPRFLPGKPVHMHGQPLDMRVVLVTVRKKPFRVFFQYQDQHAEILRLFHPQSQ